MNEILVSKQTPSIITVIGVGGAGGNAVNHMWNTGIKGVNFLICNTDQRAMDNSPVRDKIRLGKDGLGAGNDPERGREAALESLDQIKQYIESSSFDRCQRHLAPACRGSYALRPGGTRY